ncbi:helix-turn-helix domain-containing protein [Phytohabitans kaempferiae]|uniref:Helix-turn-helix domain-containing protein n=1 Tax=Phytohabitans kaempferiae TaxID=1620943 RepID=A0ABV6MEK9_9ACTN
MGGRAFEPLRIPAGFWGRDDVGQALRQRDFGALLRLVAKYAGASQTQIAIAVGATQGQVSTIMSGSRQITALDVTERILDGLGAPDDARMTFGLAPRVLPGDLDGELVTAAAFPSAIDEDGLDAVELANRVMATDVGAETLERLEAAVDGLAMAYATTPPEQLVPRTQRQLQYVVRLLDGRTTLDQHRRLLVAGGWLALLAATLRIDLRHRVAAGAYLGTARQMAEHAEHAEIQAWILETRAWEVLTVGDYRRAVDLSRQAQATAPRGSSAHIQATAQEGRAWARMGKASETRDALMRVEHLVSPLARPERPEHHYQYDPAKALSYTATTLAWVGDPGAEEYARAVIAELESAPDGVVRPRRAATARLDLGVALLAADKPDEAAAAATAAITSGRVVPSTWWRAAEILAGVEQAGIAEARALRDAFETYRPKVSTGR